MGNTGNRCWKAVEISRFCCSPACSPTRARVGNMGNNTARNAKGPTVSGRAFPNTRRSRKLVIADARPAASVKRQSPSPMPRQSGNAYAYMGSEVNRQ